MRNRIGVAATVLLACAFALRAQENMFKIELAPSGTMVSLDEPIPTGGMYVFHAWPDGGFTKLPQAKVRKITRLTGPPSDTIYIYQVELIPSGTMTARDNPTLKGNMYVFHTWRDGTLMSVRQADVRKITPMTGDKAFWVEQGLKGASKIGKLAMQGGGSVVEIGSPPDGGSQAGPTNLSAVGRRGGAGNSSSGNWLYEGTPGVSDAYAPGNASVSSPGGVPQMPAATNGSSPPQ